MFTFIVIMNYLGIRRLQRRYNQWKQATESVQASFLPTDLPNLILWLDAGQGVFNDAGSTPAVDTDTVQEWHDQSGNNTDFSQTELTKKPVFRTGIINGLPVVRFDGVDDYLIRSVVFSSATQGIVFVVYQLSGTQSEQTLFSTSNEASTTPYSEVQGFRNSVSPNITSNFHDGSQRDYLAGDTTLSTSTFYIGIWQSDDTTISMWLNGTAQSITAVLGSNDGDWWGDATGRDNFVVGARKSNSELNFLIGDIAELLVYDVALSDADRNSVQNYLADKYGITVS